MRKIFTLFVLLTGSLVVRCQDEIIQSTRHKVDSILQNIAREKNEYKRFQLNFSLYLTPLDGYPLLLFETYSKLLSIAEKNNDLISKSNAYSLRGQGYRLAGNYIKGLEFHHKAIRLAEQSGNILILSWAQNQMAHIYKDRNENDKAIRLYTSAKLNATRANEEKMTIWPALNLGAVFLNDNQLDSSLYYASYAYDRIDTMNFENKNVLKGYISSVIAGAYSKKGNIKEAEKYFRKAIYLVDSMQSPRFLNNTYTAFAEHYFRNGQQDSSIYYAKLATEVVQNTEFRSLAMRPADLLTSIYENIDADSTLKYLKIYKAANDSLFNTRTNQQLQMMTFEEEQRQRDIRAENIAYQNKIKTYLLLAGLVVFSLIAFILYRNNRQKQKSNKTLKAALSDLKATQSQLIQSEKMASLGELTAGIAHEIQNPLNFVNNFSEVSNELIDEMNQELSKGDIEEAKAISSDIKQNLEKIYHHGKRADAIVKGMLQHSRSSSGKKEPTDINALADEYLRLAYHGLRAKDKSFNAKLETQFDDNIGKIDIVPQEIGRVILNLINNAFYAVSAVASAKLESGYEPTVTVTTKKAGKKVLISVKDNGNGIPDAVKEKIFQPFFTTKPTGQGTGLGLSLSYDIVKAHGGEIKLTTMENEGTSFIILLPIL